MFGEFTRGIRAPFRGAALLLRDKSVRRLGLRPLVINVILFAFGLPLAIWTAIGWSSSWFAGVGWYGDLLRALLQLLMVMALVVAAIFLFIILGNIIAAPFNSAMAERIEVLKYGELRGVEQGGMRRSLLTTFGRLLLFLGIYPFIFATQFVPVAGVAIHAVLALLYASFVLSFDFSDPVMERHIPRFRDKIRYVLRHTARHLGFGLVCVAMAFVPFVNLLLIPVAVAGGALLFLESDERKVGS